MRALSRAFHTRALFGLTALIVAACSGRPPLVTVEVTPKTGSIAAGTTQAFTVMGRYGDGSTLDLTSAVTWSSSDESIATISNEAGAKGIATGRRVGSATINAKLEKITGKANITVTEATAVALAITPPSSTLAIGTGAQLVATATLTDGTTQDVSATAQWTSSSPAASVRADGFVEVSEIGTFQITATLNTLTATATLRGTNAELQTITITPASPSVPVGLSAQLTATGTFSDNSTQDLTSIVTWASSAAAVGAFQSASNGKVTALSLGTATLTATTMGVTGQTTLTVTDAVLTSILITPETPALAVGVSAQLTATGVLSDDSTIPLTDDVVWTSSVPSVASFAETPNGFVTAHASGMSVLTATSGTITGSVTLSVTSAVVASITVSSTATTLARGTTAQLTATATLTDGTLQDLSSVVTWSSTDELVAIVSNAAGTRGRVSTLSPGTTNVAARFGDVFSDTVLLTVTDAVLMAVAVTPEVASRPVGVAQPFVAMAVFTDGTMQDITADAAWSFTPQGIAVFSTTIPGQATGIAAGSTTVTASFQGMSGLAAFNVTSAVLASIAIAPDEATLPIGSTQPFYALGTYTDASIADVSSLTTWTSSTPSVLIVSNAAGSRGRANAVAKGSATLTATLSGITSSVANVTVTDASLVSIAITPAFASVPKGASQTYTATGTYSDGSEADLTAQATWSVQDSSVASVSTTDGVSVTPSVASGSTNVLATVDGVTGTSSLVTTAPVLASLAIAPQNVSLANGLSQGLALTGTLTDGTTQNLTSLATWTTGDPAIADVAVGTVTARADTGSTSITARLNGLTATVVVTATPAVLSSITVVPSNLVLANGTSGAFTATGTFSNGASRELTEGLSWTSSADTVVSVTSTGAVTAHQEGNVTVTVSMGEISGLATVSVTPAVLASLALTPATASLASGTTQQLTLTGTLTDGTMQDLTSVATWTSSATTVAKVTTTGSTRGLVTATASSGTATITAKVGTLTATSTITGLAPVLTAVSVLPGNVLIANGTSQQLTARGIYSDGSTVDLTSTATWTSSDISIVTASPSGRVTGAATGSATVTAQSGALSGSTVVNIVTPVLTSISVTPAVSTIASGTTVQFSAVGLFSDGTSQNITSQATWTTSSDSVTISNDPGSVGLASGLSPTGGATTVTATFSSVVGNASLTVSSASLTTISISPAAPVLANGTSLPMSANGVYSDGTTQDLTGQVTWSVSGTAFDFSTASPGLLEAINVGSGTVTATLGGVSASVSATATDASLAGLRIFPQTNSLATGTTLHLSATATYSDGRTQDVTSLVTWESDAPGTASISNQTGNRGVVTGSTPGSATISATLGATTTTATVSVTSAVLTSITLTPAVTTTARGTTTALTAAGLYSDGSIQDLTSQVTWTSANAAIAVVSNNAGTQGVATGLASGSVVITASFAGTSGSATLTVTNATLQSIAVSPAVASIANGSTIRLGATGTYSDGSTQDLSSSVTWSSSDPSVATISNAALSQGFVTGLSVGSTVLTASMGGVSNGAALTVTNATLDEIVIDPAGSSLAKGTSVQLSATGFYSDGTTQDLTSSVSWSSSGQGLSFSGTTPGLALASASGSVVVTAAMGEVLATTTVVVTNASLTALEIEPSDAALANGTTLAFTATGSYTDGTTQDVTTLVGWSSSDTAVAAVSNATGSRGLVRGLSVGAATLTVSLSGVSAFTRVTVTPAALESISITPAVATVAVGLTTTFTATGHFSDGTTQDLTTTATWQASNSDAVTRSPAGTTPLTVTGVIEGSTTLSATLDGTTGSAVVTVTAPVLQSLVVSPATLSLASGTGHEFGATGSYSDGSQRDVTSLATWTSSATSVATVSNAIGNRGFVLGVGAGDVTITASLDSLDSSAAVSVTNAALTSLVINPNSAAIPKGAQLTLTAIGTYTDGTSHDLSTQVVWSSSNAAAAPISSMGTLVGLAVGTATITATFGDSTASITATVFPPVLTTLSVDPPLSTIANGTRQHFVATGVFTDGSVQDVTSSVTWASSDENVAIVSNEAAAHGLAEAIGAGTVTVSALSGEVLATASLTVTSATLSSIAISPPSPVIANGTQIQLSATGLYTDGSSQDLTSEVIWAASDPLLGFDPGQPGMLFGVSVGAGVVTATSGAVSASTPARVTNATLTGLTITPAAPTLPTGTSQWLTARGFYSDGTSQDLSSLVIWSSSDSEVIAVSKGFVTGVAVGSATVTATFGGSSASATVTASDATLTGIEITPPFAVLAKGTSASFSANGIYTDGSVQDLTSQVAWSSSDGAVLAISNASGNTGVATAVTQGSVTVSATLDGVTGSAPVSISSATLVALSVEPSLGTIASGTSLQFTAIGVYSDDSTQDLTSSVTWTSSDETVAIISNAAQTRGLGRGAAEGEATITATLGGTSSAALLSVSSATLTSLSIAPVAPVLASGTSLQLSVTGLFSDGSNQDLTSDVTWSVSGSSLAFAEQPGLIQALTAGTGTVTATLGSTFATAQVLVTDAALTSLTITPADPVLAKGTTQGLSATGIYSDGTSQDLTSLVTWSTSAPATVTVSNATGSRGIVAAVATGSATITATIAGQSASTTVTVTGAALASLSVTPPFTSIAKGTSTALAATGLFSDETSQDFSTLVTWTSSDSTIATVSNVSGAQGVITALGSGTVTLTAAYGGFTATATVTVTTATLQSVSVSPATIAIAAGTQQQFFATGTYSDGTTQDLTSTVTWSSSNTTAATISNAGSSKGLANGASAGTASITATVGGITGTATLTVTGAQLLRITVSPSATIAVGQTYQAFATGFYSDGTSQDLTRQASWSSSNSNIATVSANITVGVGGVITGKAPGTVTITATVGSVSGFLSLTVTGATLSSIQVSPLTATLQVGVTRQFRAIATYSDGSSQDLTNTVTWLSTSTAAATVSNTTGTKGLVTGVASGSATITASFGGKSGKTTVTVSSATLTSIALSPAVSSVGIGSVLSYRATGIYNDRSTADLTAQITWSSSTPATAVISNASSNRGQATTLAAGSTTITATFGAVSANAFLTVTDATIVSISVTPPSPKIALATSASLKATALFSDGSTLDVTTVATWASADVNVASVSTISGTQGLVVGRASGTASVSATYGGVSGANTVTVTGATLQSLTVGPTGVNLPVGFTQQYTVTGRFSDGTTQDLTSQATWTTNKTSICLASNDGGRGLVYGVSSGNTQVQASIGTLNAKTNIRVISATLTSIAVAPAAGSSLSVPVGFATHLTATGTFSDGSTRDISSTATWYAADGSIAMPAASGAGYVTGMTTGSTTVTAAVGARTQTVTLTVKNVTLSSIAVTTTSGAASVAIGANLSVKATGTFSDSSTLLISDQCSWSSADPTRATVVAGNPAIVTGVARSTGGTAITATAAGVSGALTVVVP